jgi:pyruvate/2-oxoacid:ferredoxin oxidoreductase alpha subunit
LDPSKAGQIWSWYPTTPVSEILEEIAGHAEKNPDWLNISAPL